MSHKAVFFDFDGTFMDTAEGVIEGGKYAFLQIGVKIPELSDWSVFIGPPLTECFRILAGIDDPERLKTAVEEYRKYYNRIGYTQAKFFPGILDLIRKLRVEGRTVVCTTLKTEFLANKMLSHFGVEDLFDGVFGLDLAEKVTKADLCRNAMKQFGLKPEDCILVGDTKFDREGAREAGIDFVPVGWGFEFKEKDGAVMTMDELYSRL